MTFRKPETCGQTVLPDRSHLIGQKLLENAKIEHVAFTQCLKITKNVAFEFFNFGIFH